MRVLVAEDDVGLRNVLARGLRENNYVVDAVADGEEALRFLRSYDYELAVLDWRMPGMSGLDVLRWIRSRQRPTPVLMLTARDAYADRVTGLDAGADDYLVKPFALAELRARLRALLRRSGGSTDQLTFGDLVLDLEAVRAIRGGRELSLTRTEYLLLELFMRNPGRVLSQQNIFLAVWGYDFGQRSNNLWVYMSYLRSKLEANGEPRLLQTVRGLGYVLRGAP